MAERRILFLFFIFLLLSSTAQAARLAPQGTSERKFQRGLLNAFFSPLELTHEIAGQKTKDRILPTWFPGLVRGIVFTSARAVTGVYEVLTAPIPSPPHYAPVYHPEFSLEHLGFLKENGS